MNRPPPPPPPPPRIRTGREKKSRKIWWILLLVGIPLGLFLIVVAILGLGALFVYTADEQPVTDAERQVIVDAYWVAEWFEDLEVNENYEVLKKLRYFDGSYDVEYEYDNLETDEAPYINCTLTIEKSASDAKFSYLPLWEATKVGLSIGGDDDVGLEERNDVFSWGDKSRFGFLTYQGERYGNLLVARNGKKVFYLVLCNYYFEDAELIAEFLQPVLQSAMAYDPEDTG